QPLPGHKMLLRPSGSTVEERESLAPFFSNAQRARYEHLLDVGTGKTVVSDSIAPRRVHGCENLNLCTPSKGQHGSTHIVKRVFLCRMTPGGTITFCVPEKSRCRKITFLSLFSSL